MGTPLRSLTTRYPSAGFPPGLFVADEQRTSVEVTAYSFNRTLQSVEFKQVAACAQYPSKSLLPPVPLNWRL